MRAGAEPKPGVDQQWCADDEQGDAEGDGEPTTGDDRRQNDQRKRHEQVRRGGVQEEQPPPAITEDCPRVISQASNERGGRR
jgi:hypothetical protein